MDAYEAYTHAAHAAALAQSGQHRRTGATRGSDRVCSMRGLSHPPMDALSVESLRARLHRLADCERCQLAGTGRLQTAIATHPGRRIRRREYQSPALERGVKVRCSRAAATGLQNSRWQQLRAGVAGIYNPSNECLTRLCSNSGRTSDMHNLYLDFTRRQRCCRDAGIPVVMTSITMAELSGADSLSQWRPLHGLHHRWRAAGCHTQLSRLNGAERGLRVAIKRRAYDALDAR